MTADRANQAYNEKIRCLAMSLHIHACTGFLSALYSIPLLCSGMVWALSFTLPVCLLSGFFFWHGSRSVIRLEGRRLRMISRSYIRSANRMKSTIRGQIDSNETVQDIITSPYGYRLDSFAGYSHQIGGVRK